jgi:hypothetical protein
LRALGQEVSEGDRAVVVAAGRLDRRFSFLVTVASVRDRRCGGAPEREGGDAHREGSEHPNASVHRHPSPSLAPLLQGRLMKTRI